MKNTTERVKSAVLNHSEKNAGGLHSHVQDKSSEEAKAARRDAAHEKRKQYTLLSDSIAGSPISQRNWLIPAGRKLFPEDWRSQYADLFYPYAEGGPLFVDTPISDAQVERCKVKCAELAKAGVRYVYICHDDNESTLRARMAEAQKEWPTQRAGAKAKEISQ